MKRYFRTALAAALTAALLLPTALCADFTAVRAAFSPENYPFHEQAKLRLRYTDDKTPIPLSYCYLSDKSLFATVPAAYAARAIEVYSAPAVPFADETAEDPNFHVISELSRTGVITDDTDGKAHPERAVTRAEACTMLVRTLGVPPEDGAASGFQDVPPGRWFAPAVQTARAYGIVSPAALFSPDRAVTREEFTAMTARTLEAAGLLRIGTPQPMREFADAGAIAPWAAPSYAALGSRNIATDIPSETEADGDGAPLTLFYAEPRKAATRGECARLLYSVISAFSVYPSQAARENGFDKAMPSVDGSTSTYPFTEAVYSSLFSNGLRHPAIPAEHSKSHASYERLIAGEVDMLFASVYPSSDILALAKEKSVTLELIPIAYDAMVFFTNTNNPATGLTTAQIGDIYVDNAYTNWKALGGPDALLYPCCRNNDSGSHAQMERHFLNGREIHPAIREETTSVSMASVLTDVKNAQTVSPPGYGLGYSIFYYFRSTEAVLGTSDFLKLLSIDGVAPTDETITDGSYPLSNNTYLVLRGDTPQDAPARRLAAFMLTEAGQDCVRNAGSGPLTPADAR